MNKYKRCNSFCPGTTNDECRCPTCKNHFWKSINNNHPVCRCDGKAQLRPCGNYEEDWVKVLKYG